MLDITTTIQDSKARIALEGRLDTVSTEQLSEAFEDCRDGLTELELDFGGLEYISSAGLRELLYIQKAMTSANGTMTLVNVDDIIMDILDLTGFVDVLNIEKKQ